jgi:hypothetical protein
MVQNIRDFRTSPLFQKELLANPHRYISDEDLALSILQDLEKKESLKSYWTALKDAHILSNSEITDEGVCFKVQIGLRAVYDGIYDIWLGDCANVTSISVAFNDVVVPIEEFKIRDDNRIQIPLSYLSSNGAEVNQMFNEKVGWLQQRLSFIPSIAIQFDTLVIKLNPGARCNVRLSTLYFQTFDRRVLVQSRSTFYVNGMPLQAISGEVHKVSDTDQQGCRMF